MDTYVFFIVSKRVRAFWIVLLIDLSKFAIEITKRIWYLYSRMPKSIIFLILGGKRERTDKTYDTESIAVFLHGKPLSQHNKSSRGAVCHAADGICCHP